MKSTLNKLLRHEILSREEAFLALADIGSGKVNASQMAAFMTIYLMRPISLEELSGFRDALLETCLSQNFSDFDPIDLCGTGGDGKDTFNISTLAAFVTAGCGIPVAKHGNYGVSSVSGSSNVLEALGISFTNDSNKLKQSLDKAGICFLHAPLFHPAMKHVAPIRKDIGLRTFFNLLGPLVNPARVTNQVAGVFNLEIARLYHYLFQESDMNYAVVHSLDGYDEISLTSDWKFLTKDSDAVFAADYFGKSLSQTDLHGGSTIEASARIFTDILSGNGTFAQNQAVCANAAAAISLMKNCSLPDAFQLASESLSSGKAKICFESVRNLS